jgi:hypothetical protein
MPSRAQIIGSHAQRILAVVETYSSVFGHVSLCSSTGRSECHYKAARRSMGTVSQLVLLFDHIVALMQYCL